MPSREKTLQQIAELGLAEKIVNQECLNSLAEISAYTGWSITKVRQRIKNHGLPASREGRQYFTTKSAIRIWLATRHIRAVEAHNWDKRTMHGPYHGRR
jgi:hypothetical protein